MSAKYFKIQEADKNVRKLQSENTKMSENSLEVKGQEMKIQ